jgi:hypothetical protein
MHKGEAPAPPRTVTATFADIRANADAAAKKIADNAANLNGAKAATEDWGKAFADAKKRAEDIGKVIEGLQTDLATFGMTDGQKKLFDLKALGADPAQIEQAQRLIEQLDAKQKAKEITDAFAGIAEDFAKIGMTDVEAKLFDLKKLGLDPAQLEQARQMLEQIEAAKGKQQDRQGPQLMLSGSAEAQKLAYTASIGIKTVSNDVQARQLREQQAGNETLARIEANTRQPAGLQAFA